MSAKKAATPSKEPVQSTKATSAEKPKAAPSAEKAQPKKERNWDSEEEEEQEAPKQVPKQSPAKKPADQKAPVKPKPESEEEEEEEDETAAKSPAKPSAAPAASKSPATKPAEKKDEGKSGLARVLPFLYQGSAAVAENKAELQKVGIKRVLNLTDGKAAHADDFAYTNWPIKESDSLDGFFTKAFDFLAESKAVNANVLVYCQDGLSLSPAFCLAYMMTSASKLDKHLPLQQVTAHIKKVNAGVKFLPAHLKALQEYEKKVYADFESDNEEEEEKEKPKPKPKAAAPKQAAAAASKPKAVAKPKASKPKKEESEEEEESGEEEESEEEEQTAKPAKKPAAAKKPAPKKGDNKEEDGSEEEEEESSEEEDKPAGKKPAAKPKAKPATKTEVKEETKDDAPKKPRQAKSEADMPQIRGLIRVLPYLYLGGVGAAQNKDELQRLRITKILNCCSEEIDNFFPDDFEYTTMDLEDTHDCDIASEFGPAYELLTEVKEKDERILVHCTDGHKISPTLVLAYMMRATYGQGKFLPLNKACEHLQKLEPGCQPSEAFMLALLDLEKELYGENSMKVQRAGKSGGFKPRRGGRGGNAGKGRRGK